MRPGIHFWSRRGTKGDGNGGGGVIDGEDDGEAVIETVRIVGMRMESTGMDEEGWVWAGDGGESEEAEEGGGFEEGREWGGHGVAFRWSAGSRGMT